MSDFQELLKNVDKCRDYVRDFFVYGFKSRSDFSGRSVRTYDDERRRIVSWLQEYVQEDLGEDGRSKNISLQLDQNRLQDNPLFRVWQTRSYTDADISLHFFLLKLLEDEDAAYTAAELTDLLMDEFACEAELQTVRRKCNEYVEEGLLHSRKDGKRLLYTRGLRFDELLEDTEGLRDALKCFQLDLPLGVVAGNLLAALGEENEYFRVKHAFPTFTLEDDILLELLQAIHEEASVRLQLKDRECAEGVPLQIFVSQRSGRRYVAMCGKRKRGGLRFFCIRLDLIKAVENGRIVNSAKGREKLEQKKDRLWGVSFASHMPGAGAAQKLSLVLRVSESREAFILQRLQREGRDAHMEWIGEDTLLYEKTVFDVWEMFPWIRSFIGRIEKLQIYNMNGERLPDLEDIFIKDLQQMYELYEPKCDG